MNTPDTENNNGTGSNGYAEVPQNLKGAAGETGHTPDTEWEKEFDGRMTSLSRYGGFYHGNKNGVELFDFDNIKAFITKTLTSRDTYWKERVREEVEKVREAQIEHKDTCPQTFNRRKLCDCGARTNQRINTALDTLLDNLK